VPDPLATPSPPAAGPRAAGALRACARNLKTGLTLLGLRRRWPAQLDVSFDQVALLLLVNLLVWAGLDKMHAPHGAPFQLDGLFGWASYLLLGLIACALVSRVQSRAGNTRALLVATLSVSPFVLALFWLAQDLPALRARPLLITIIALVYLGFLAVRVLGAAFGIVRLRPALLALLFLVAAPWALVSLNLDTRLWVADEAGDSQSDEDAAQAEVLFYDQPARIAAAAARLRPTQPGATSLYFVGFAGDGEPPLFRHEAQFAGEVFARRYGTEGRSLLLINDLEDRDSYPLASVSGLAQALKVLAARMDPDNDVLVLFLTSHGSQDGLEVQNGSLPLAQLAPADLHEALDSAGIRWRIIVVSACYAGVFLDELRNDNTAIITAADAEHTSFGCEEDRKLTWFGEAFLQDALPGSATLTDAFNKASALIAQREDAEHQVHSNPQLFVGDAMKRKLATVEAGRPGQDRHSFTVKR
jgi:Peptidase C13 family